MREKEKAYLPKQIVGQAVARVLVNDKPRELPKTEGITVSPRDVKIGRALRNSTLAMPPSPGLSDLTF